MVQRVGNPLRPSTSAPPQPPFPPPPPEGGRPRNGPWQSQTKLTGTNIQVGWTHAERHSWKLSYMQPWPATVILLICIKLTKVSVTSLLQRGRVISPGCSRKQAVEFKGQMTHHCVQVVD
jgi:hypothetical protein